MAHAEILGKQMNRIQRSPYFNGHAVDSSMPHIAQIVMRTPPRYKPLLSMRCLTLVTSMIFDSEISLDCGNGPHPGPGSSPRSFAGGAPKDAMLRFDSMHYPWEKKPAILRSSSSGVSVVNGSLLRGAPSSFP